MPHQSGHLQESSFPLWRTWACHAKALPHRLLLQARGETQKEAEELKKANILSFNIVKVNYVGRYWPRPLEATSVAMRIGALPYLNSEITKGINNQLSAPSNLWWICKRTIENPVSFLLAFISMDAHSWPPTWIEEVRFATSVLKSKQEFHLPIPSHSSGEIIAPPLCFHKYDGLVLLFTHNFFKQADKSLRGKFFLIMQWKKWNYEDV